VLAIILGAIAVISVWLLSTHWPLSSAQGQELRGIATKANSSIDTFTVGTYNIHRGRGLDGQRNLARIGRVIENCDVVGLQEVEGPGLRYFGNQAYDLGQKCGYVAHFSPTRRHFFFPHRGNALLTRLLVQDWQREPLSPTTGKAYRNVTIYRLFFNETIIYILNTHLSKPAEQIAPLQRVIEIFLGLERAVLLGDFNSRALDGELESLLGADVEDATALASNDPMQVDRILVRGLEVSSARSEAPGASDHPFFSATLRLK
jgi:endonuclease/exonuclease/phosphatase family metal-dependent hydrolase